MKRLRFGYRERVTDTHLAHVKELPEVLPGIFAAAAVRAREAGFDGVELHYAHAYTMASFLSRRNDRADGYGGSPEARVRLPLEVYAEVRRRVGADYVVGARFLGDEVIEGGSRVQDAAYYGVEFARAGMDFISVSKGGKFEDAKQPKVGHAVYPYTGQSGYECMPTVISDARGPFGRSLPLVREIKRAVGAAGFKTPVVGTGGVGTFELAEEILRGGDADIVGFARQALADPDWFLKVRLGRGRRGAPLHLHQLLRGARPDAQAGHVQALGSGSTGRARHRAQQRRSAPALPAGVGTVGEREGKAGGRGRKGKRRKGTGKTEGQRIHSLR